MIDMTACLQRSIMSRRSKCSWQRSDRRRDGDREREGDLLWASRLLGHGLLLRNLDRPLT